MGTITRHPDAPFQDGEFLTGADLEADFATIYDEFNGGIDDANLADGAVTTSKLAANAVTQAKITSGAATASEVVVDVSAAGIAVTNGAAQSIGAAISHTVGNPARHVVIYVSFSSILTAANELKIKMLKDGVSMIPNQEDTITNLGASSAGVTCTRAFIDSAPTPGGTHSYQFQARTTVAGSGAIENLMIFAFEPRS